MRNKYQLLKLAKDNDIQVKKQLKTWTTSGQLVVLEVDKPIAEIRDELEEAGLLP